MHQMKPANISDLFQRELTVFLSLFPIKKYHAHTLQRLVFLENLPKEEPVIGHSQVEDLSRLQRCVD